MTWLRTLALALLLATPALADDPKPNFVGVQLEGVRSAFGAPMGSMAGFSVEFGAMQSRFFGTATRIGYQREMGDGVGQALTLLSGFRGQFPIGERLLVMPNLNLGLRLGNSFGYAAYFDLGVAWRASDMYFGLAFATPVFLEGGNGASPLFPAIYSVNAVAGFFY